MERFSQELRQVVRTLVRTPAFTLVAVATLALGIGANTAIFTVVNSVLLRPLPYPAQERLVVAHHKAPGMGVEDVPHSEATYLLYAQENRTFDAIGVVRDMAVNLTGGGDPERIPAIQGTHEILPLLGASPVLGRATMEEDDRPGAPEVALISYALWQRRYGGDPSILERSVEVNGVPRTIVGVLPQGFLFPEMEGEVFLPARFDRTAPDEGSFNYNGIARLKEGTTVQDAAADIARMIRIIPERFSGMISLPMLEQIQFAPNVRLLKGEMVGEVSQALWILLAAVGFLLLIACANVANLFLVRAEGRQREVAVRTALGASWGTLARRFLSESLVLGAWGGALGLVLAMGGIRALVAFGPESLPRLQEIGVDIRVVLFTLALSVMAGILFGIFPVLKVRRPDMVAGLKEGGRGGSAGRERHRARNTLVVTQMALALILLVGSGLMLRSFQVLRSVDPGFDPRGVLSLRLTLPNATYPDGASRLAFHETLLASLAGLPGVESVGAGESLPMGGGINRSGTWIEDFPLLPDQIPDVIETNPVSAGYMETLGIRLLEGRLIEPADARDRTGAAVVTRTFAQHYWPDGSAVGKRLTQNIDLGQEASGAETPWQTIVGVVEDVRTMGMDRDPIPVLYLPLAQAVPEGSGRTPGALAYVLRTQGPPTALLPSVRETVWNLDPNLPIAEIQTMDAVVRRSMARTSFTMVLLAIAALVSLLLGTVGIYGVISYLVTQRTREMGIRLALGAEESAVEGMVLRQGAILAGLGILLGMGGAFGLTRLMRALLFEVSATDPMTFASVPVVLGGVALLATWLPARRAARTDPAVALRQE